MATVDFTNIPPADFRGHVGGFARQVAGLRKTLFPLLWWPFTGLFLIASMVAVMSLMLADEKRGLDADALKDATAFAKQYADQLARTIDQIDEITVNIKAQWEATPNVRDLGSRLGAGLFPLSSQFYVLLVDRNGRVIRTLHDSNGPPVSLADRAYFQVHKSGPSSGLMITKLPIGRVSTKERIVFSRRVNAVDGSFAGIVIVSVEPSFLASYIHPEDLGKKDFLVAVGLDGAQYSPQVNDSAKDMPRFFLSDPVFPTPAGRKQYHGEAFTDRTARSVAWRTLEKYPLRVVSGISEEQEFMPYAASLEHFRKIGYAIAILLALFSVTGMTFSMRLARRNQHAEDVKNTYRLAVDAARDGFYMVEPICDAGGAIIDFEVADCNQRGAAYYEMTPAKLIGMRFTAFASAGQYVQQVIGIFRNAMTTGYYEDEFEVPVLSPLGPTWLHRRLMRSQNGLAVTLRDISETKAHERALARMVNEDKLTGLLNRNWLTAYLPAAVERARESNTALGLLFVDLDNFKDVNDTLGHAVGDELLKAVATRLRSLVRPEDNVTRLGGDEFNIVIENVSDRLAISDVADRIVAAFNEPITLGNGTSYPVRASIGISFYPEDGSAAELLLKHADIAMYEAKAAGKGGYQLFKREFLDKILLRVELEQALLAAIARDEFTLYFQPRVDTFTGELRSMEALVRWIHPERGVVPPAEFIDIAERTGLIVPLGQMVIDKACAQIAAWRDARLSLVPVSVNVSPRQFAEGDLGAVFAQKIAQYGIPVALIEAEVTESSMMGDSEEIATNLAALEALGMRLLVDDFGTGYASLSQLQRLRMDGLKVDRSFTTALDQTPDGAVFYRAILSMAHALGMSVVAEGVETLSQLKLLQAMSCEEIQGYYVSPPVPAARMAEFMLKRFLFPVEAMPFQEKRQA